MVDNRDWIDWDNSMKSHIDQIEVKWKNDLVLALEQTARIQQLQTDLNDELIERAEESKRQHQRTAVMVGLCWALLFINLAVAVIAIREVYAP